MTLPVIIPNTFANATTSIPLSQLDANFSTLSNAVNGINSGSEILANLKSSNVTITGGVISNVTLDNVTVDVETLSNVTINGGNVTVTNMVATTANATTGNITTVNATTIDTTNIEVTNIKAKDGTAALSIADSTGVTTQSTPAVISVSSSSDALRITQTGAGNALVVEDSTNPDSTPFVIDATGNVVIGKTTQFSGSITPKFELVATTPSDASIGLYNFNTTSSGATLEFGQSNNATAGSQTVVASGDNLGVIRFSGSDGTAMIRGAQIVAAVDGTPGTNDMPGRLVFSTTADGASSPTERMRIRSDGNIGVGNSGNPNATLTLAKDITGSTTAAGIYQAATIQSGVTSAANINWTNIFTAASAFTVNTINHYNASQGTIGAGSAVTNQIGFRVDSSLTGATNNYGFYGNIASGSGRWNFYANGTAANAFSGDVKIFGAGGLGYATGSGGAVTQATNRTTGVTLDKTNGAITLVSAAGTTTWQTFTVTNSTVAATDTIIINQKSGADLYEIHITAVAAGSFNVTYRTTGGTTTEQPVFNFAVIKAVAA